MSFTGNSALSPQHEPVARGYPCSLAKKASRLNSSVYFAAGFGMASSFLVVSLHSKGFGFL